MKSISKAWSEQDVDKLKALVESGVSALRVSVAFVPPGWRVYIGNVKASRLEKAGSRRVLGSLALLNGEIVLSHLANIGVDPGSHTLFLFETSFQQGPRFFLACRTAQRQQRLVGRDFEMLESIVGERVLQVSSPAIALAMAIVLAMTD